MMGRRKISARQEDCRPGNCGGLSTSSRRQKKPGCFKKLGQSYVSLCKFPLDSEQPFCW